MSTIQFPSNIKYTYASVIPGDYVTNVNTDWSYRYAYVMRSAIKVFLDTSSVTNMSGMFYECSSLTAIPQFDTSSVTNMNYMFGSCSSLTAIPQFDTSSVTNMSGMFSGCSSLTAIPQFDTSSVTNMSSIFGSTGLSNLTDFGGFKNLGMAKSLSSPSSNFLSKTTNLTHESLMNVINNLYDRKSAGYSNLTIDFGSTNLAKLTDEEKAIATNKGWTLK